MRAYKAVRVRAQTDSVSTIPSVNQATVRLERPIYLTRSGNTFTLAFSYDADLVERVKQLPYARFDSEGKTWTVDVTTDAVTALRDMFLTRGLTDVCVDELLHDGESIPETAPATLRGGSLRRPFLVLTATRDETLYQRLKTIPGGQWERTLGGITYPATSAAALGELAHRGILADPDKILTPAAITITFDGRTGTFAVLGDHRAQAAFTRNFPARDIVSVWQERGYDTAFSDPFTEEVYRGELARHHALQPDGLLEPLFDYQAQSVAVAVERSGFGIFDQPGLGKTAQAIAWAHELMNNRHEAPRTIVVVPGAVKTQFGREITRFTGNTDVVVIDGDKKKREKLYAQAHDARWVVLNYDLLHLDNKKIAPLASGALLIADEAHRCKNRTSKRTQAIRALANKAARRLALTGTPVENNPSEWFTIMNTLVIPGVLGSPIDFLNRYCYPGRFGGYEGARNLNELRDRSAPHYIRHDKKTVAKHLPPLIVQNIVLDPDDKLASALKRAHRDAQEEIADAATDRRGGLSSEAVEEIETGAAMTAVGMLRLMCSSPRLLYRSDADAARALVEAGLVPDEDGPKLEHLIETATAMAADGQRLVVFSSFRTMVNLISERLKEAGIEHVTFTGQSSTAERDAAVTAFTTPGTDDNPGPTVFLATDAASEGLNLGACCSTLVNFDLAFKPSTMIQRANRIHRVDGDPNRRYLVMNYTLARTVEEGILRMVGSKADLSDAILGERGGRRATTGRGGKNVFEEALRAWAHDAG